MFRVLTRYTPTTIVVVDLSRRKSFKNIPDEYPTLTYGKYYDWKWKFYSSAFNYFEDAYSEDVDLELSDMRDAIKKLFCIDERELEFFRK